MNVAHRTLMLVALMFAAALAWAGWIAIPATAQEAA